MADQVFDVYGDLDEFELEQVVKEKNDAYKNLEEKYDLALQTIKNLHADVNIWKKKCHNIEKSFWSLLETSKTEIKRKDVQLDALRRQRDDKAFRRVKPNNKLEIDRDLDNETSSVAHFNPFRHNSSQHTGKTDELRNKNVEFKKSIKDDCQQKDNERYTNENKETKIHNNGGKCVDRSKVNKTFEKNSKDSATSSNIQTNQKEENSLIKNRKSNYADKNSEKNYHSPEKQHHKDDNRSKNHKDDFLKNNKIDRESKRQEKERLNVENNSESDTGRICKLSRREDIKLTVTFQNTNTIEKTQETTLIPVSKSTLITDTSDRKENKNSRSEIGSTKINCEKSAKKCISELMADLKKSNNNIVATVPAENTNKKTFEDILFDNMVCGDEALSVVEENSMSNVNEANNFNKLTCRQHENVEEICINLEKSSKESISLDSYEIPLENPLTLDPNVTAKEIVLGIAEEFTESTDQHLNTNDYGKNIAESAHGEKENKQLHKTDQLPNNTLVVITAESEELSTPTENSFQHKSIEKSNLIIEANIEKKSLNNSATKFYDLYLDSPVKKIQDINEKNTIIINDDTQNICNPINADISEENKQEFKKNSSNENLFDQHSETNIELDEEVEHIKKISNSPKKINDKNNTAIWSELKEGTQSQKLEKISEKQVEKEKIDILNENETDFEVADIIETNQMKKNAENDKIEILNFDHSSESIITPITMSPNQKETMEATKYLTEILQTNMPSTSSPLKYRLKLLFGDTPETPNKVSKSSKPALTIISTNNIIENLQTNNENITEDFCELIIDDTIIENPALPCKEPKIILTTPVQENKNIKGRSSKRKAEISPKSQNLNIPNTKKLKTDLPCDEKEANILKRSDSADTKHELNAKIPTRRSKRSHLTANKDIIQISDQTENEPQKLNNSIQLNSESEVVSKKLKESIDMEDRKFPLHENLDNDNCLPAFNQIDNNALRLKNFTNKENIVRTSETDIDNAVTESDIFTINICRKKRKHKKQNTESPKIEQNESLNQLNLANSNNNSTQEISKLSQFVPQTIEERKECIKNFKIPKLNKTANKNNDQPVLKNFKIPKINKNSQKTQDKAENANLLLTDCKEKPQIEDKTKINEICDNLPTPFIKSPSKKASKDEKLNKNIGNENASIPKQNNIAIPKSLSKNDEELFDCIFKSPLQISADNNTFEPEISADNGANFRFNQVEEDFRKLFGKSPQSSPALMSPTNSISTRNENHPLEKDETENLLNLSEKSEIDTVNNVTNNSSSSLNESSILRKSFSTSNKVYQMEYDEKEGITNWTITRKKIKKKKKTIC